MKQYQYLAAVLLAMGLTVASGAVIGKMSSRWGPSQGLLAAASKLEEFPEQFGNWKLQSRIEMGGETVKMLECSSHISRVYVNQESEPPEIVSVIVILGPSGPTAVHTPEVCFSSRANETLESRIPIAVGNSDDRFWAMTFESNDLHADLIRVYYGWTPGNHWAATEDPRISLAWCPYLYKIQLESRLPAGSDLTSNDPCKNFLEDFVPVMKEYLVDCSGNR